MDEKEKKNSRYAFIITFALHGVVFALFFLLIAWRAPDPPIQEFGIELNLGMDVAGSGEEQPLIPIQEGVETTVEDKKPTVEPVEEPVKAITSDEPSEVAIPEVKKETKEKEPEVEKKEEKKPVVTKPEVKETPKNPEAAEGKVKGKTDGAPVGGTQGQGAEGVAGDRGNPKGTIDGKALYGGGGGGNGLALNMAGWAWADQPKLPSLGESEAGRIVFEIECDEDGEIVGIKTLERGVSARVEQLLKEEIQRNSLMRTSGDQVPQRSKGHVVFVVKAK